MIGKTISHYRILEELGRGGMGVVYKAEDTKLKRTVALKFLPHHLLANKEDKTRFLHEAQAASALNHPNIMTIHEIDEVEKETFISMEYIEGETLKDKLEKGPLKIKELLNITIAVADGLNAAHEQEIVHRDIKSENIMISKAGLVKIMDFGLAKRKGMSKVTKTGSTLGTLAYMSPEQAEGLEVDRRSDLFSFGVVMYEMATGQLPFKGEHDAAILYSIVNEVPLPVTTLNPNIPQELERFIHKALEKEPEDRYQHADDLVADLRKLKKDLESGKTIEATQAPVEVVTGEGLIAGRRKKILVGVGIVAVIFLVGLWRFLDVGTFIGGPSEVKMDLGKPVKRPTIAVLPFTPMSLGEDIDYLADGMTEAIINELVKVGALRVASRTSVMRYKETTKDIREIGEELGVNAVLEGSVQLAANRLRVTAQLVDVSKGFHLWSNSYDRDYEDIFDVQDDVALSIAQALKVELSPGEEEALKIKPVKSVQAYDYYLKGREYYFRYKQEEMRYAIQMFEKAIEVDSNYALAYAGLGDAYAQMVNQFGWPEAWLDTSIAMSKKALYFDKESAEAYKALGLAYGTAGEYEKAIDANLEAVKWNPTYWMAVGNLGWYNLRIGRYEEARKWNKRQLEIDPMTPFSHLLSGSIYEVSGNYRLAEEEYKRAVDLQPDFTPAIMSLGWLYTLQGRMDDGKKYMQTSLELERSRGTFTELALASLMEGEYDRAESLFEESRPIRRNLDYESDIGLGFIAAKNKNIEDARKHLSDALNKVEELLNRSPETVSAKLAMAEIYSIKNEPEASLKWLREVTDTGYRNYLWLETDPYLENIRSEPEFKFLLERMRRD